MNPRRLLSRLLQAVVTVFCIMGVCFALMLSAPGGPAAMLAENPGLTPDDIERLRRNYGLDQPWYLQYGRWSFRVLVQGDLGISYATGQPVAGMILERLPATVELMVCAALVSVICAVLLGMRAARYPGGVFDRAAAAASAGGLAIPNFWLGILAILVFGGLLGWLPTGGRIPVDSPADVPAHLRSLVLPVSVLSLSSIAGWSRYVRAGVLNAMREGYIRTARAKGVTEHRLLWRHAFRNAGPPLLHVIGAQAPAWFTGAIVTEIVFAWPGAGRLFYEGVLYHDYPRLMGILVVVSILVVGCNLLVDVLHAWLDPRVQTGG